MNIAKEYNDDPELAKTFKEASGTDETKLKEEQARLEQDASVLRVRAQELEGEAVTVERQQRTLLWGIVAALALLVVGIGLAGIVFTHKVAGPIFKMKRLLREVGEGKLVVREKLRKGDELHHFFSTFEKMVYDLRAKQQAEIAKLDAIIVKLDDADVSSRGTIEIEEDGLTMLKKLRTQMQDQLEA
jgi:signal transduction histidine kinase